MISFSKAQKLDTEETTVTLKDLTPSVEYELVVKAGNANGTSILSPPITFVVADKFIIKTNGAQPSTEIGLWISKVLYKKDLDVLSNNNASSFMMLYFVIMNFMFYEID